MAVGLAPAGTPRWEVDDHLDELAALAETAGAEVLERVVQSRGRIDPATFVGRGKLAEVRTLCDTLGAGLVIFDDDLTGSQVRNVEEIVGRKVVDRTEVILDIFARRARSAEAKVQVELAQLKYRLSRLVGKGLLLSRQGGGIGGARRGPGETKLETDRRRIRDRISTLGRRLEGIARRRAIRRRGRRGTRVCAVVGYTNVGKSTLVAALSRSDLFVEDRLFATLDAATRRAWLGDAEVLLTDTVGFIRKFPPHLAASFRSTLEEVADADAVLHVVDAAHPRREEQARVVEETIEDLGAAGKPRLLVFNKCDLLDVPPRRPGAICVSARTGAGLDDLRSALAALALPAPVGRPAA